MPLNHFRSHSLLTLFVSSPSISSLPHRPFQEQLTLEEAFQNTKANKTKRKVKEEKEEIWIEEAKEGEGGKEKETFVIRVNVDLEKKKRENVKFKKEAEIEGGKLFLPECIWSALMDYQQVFFSFFFLFFSFFFFIQSTPLSLRSVLGGSGNFTNRQPEEFLLVSNFSFLRFLFSLTF